MHGPHEQNVFPAILHLPQLHVDRGQATATCFMLQGLLRGPANAEDSRSTVFGICLNLAN